MTVTLPIEPRVKSKAKNKSVITEKIAAVVYGPKYPATPVSVDKKEFDKTFKTAGESTIIELTGLDHPVDVLIKDVSFGPLKGGIVHVDFYVVEKGKEMTAHIPLHFIGESPATKLGAVLNKVLHEVTVTCKPNDLPAHLEVDLSKLVAMEDKLHVSDIICPKGVKIGQDAHDVVVQAEAVEEEPVVEEAVILAAEVPVEKKGKEETE